MQVLIFLFYWLVSFFVSCASINCTSNVCARSAPCELCETNEVCQTKSCGVKPTFQCVFPRNFCDGTPDCDNCFDEMCPGSNLFFCEDELGCVEFSNKGLNGVAFCDGREHCSDGSDERTVGYGFKCIFKSNLLGCIVPQHYLEKFVNNTEVKVCENDANRCFNVTNGTKYFDSSKCWSCLEGTIIQRQQVCNGIFDCPDLSDECLCNRDGVENICKNIFRNKNCSPNQISCPVDGKCLNVAQICDGIKDCSDGFDERNCSNSNPCMPTYSCPLSRITDGRQLAVPCDGFIECPHAEDECNCGDNPWYCNHTNTILSKLTSGNCTIKFSQVCDKQKDCLNGEDEAYCPHLQLCDPDNATLGVYNNRDCGINTDRCNLEATCANNADEINCSGNTHFYCDDYKNFTPQWHRFDGNFDCADLTDECPFEDTSVSSPTELVHDLFLRVFLWILMFLSLTGNTAVLIKTSFELHYALWRQSHNSVNRVDTSNKLMILNLAFSDFLLGIYLLVIVIKTIEFSGVYCRMQQEWLQSSMCNSLGVLAVISSQTSVFLMVLLTSYRLYGVTNPFRANKMRNRMIYITISLIWMISLAVAIVPIIPSLEVSFRSRLYIFQPYISTPMSFPDLENLFKRANRLPGIRDRFQPPTNLTMQTFCQLFAHSTSKPSYCMTGNMDDSNTTGYYGSDGVCLPRYYASRRDPASAYTLGIIGFNCAAFLYIFIAYLWIYRITSGDLQQVDSHWGSVDEIRLKENRALWSRIVRLIATNFVCWMPVSIISFTAFNGVNVPNVVYPITAIVLIPINSAANPWLYSSFLVNIIKKRSGFFQSKSKSSKKQENSASNSRYAARQKNVKNEWFKRSKRRRSVPERSMEVTPNLLSSVANTINENITVANTEV